MQEQKTDESTASLDEVRSGLRRWLTFSFCESLTLVHVCRDHTLTSRETELVPRLGWTAGFVGRLRDSGHLL
jgi:hypothetical protein